MYRSLFFIFILYAILLLSCTYMPEHIVLGVFAYDENTNGIAGLKVTFLLTTNGVSDTDIKYTDTNGLAESKVFTFDYNEL